jgi:hypothetical protein
LKRWCGAVIDTETNTVSRKNGSVELTKNEMLILKLSSAPVLCRIDAHGGTPPVFSRLTHQSEKASE